TRSIRDWSSDVCSSDLKIWVNKFILNSFNFFPPTFLYSYNCFIITKKTLTCQNFSIVEKIITVYKIIANFLSKPFTTYEAQLSMQIFPFPLLLKLLFVN